MSVLLPLLIYFKYFKNILSFKIDILLIFSQLQKQLSVLPENNQGNEDPGVNSEDDDYDAEV